MEKPEQRILAVTEQITRLREQHAAELEPLIIKLQEAVAALTSGPPRPARTIQRNSIKQRVLSVLASEPQGLTVETMAERLSLNKSQVYAALKDHHRQGRAS